MAFLSLLLLLLLFLLLSFFSFPSPPHPFGFSCHLLSTLTVCTQIFLKWKECLSVVFSSQVMHTSASLEQFVVAGHCTLALLSLNSDPVIVKNAVCLKRLNKHTCSPKVDL